MIKLSSPATQEFWEIPVLYEDEHLLALDKPAGLLSAPTADQPDRPDLVGLLHKAIAESKPWAASKGLSFLMCPQGLDAEVSGVLLFAKSKPVLMKLADLFGSEQPILSFITLVHGSPAENSFSVQANLAPHATVAGLMKVSRSEGKRARSRFEVMERFIGWALIRCSPLTWRAHQLRAHLAHIRLSVAGDVQYRGKPLLLSALKKDYHLKPKKVERPLLGSPRLHAEQLVLNHPVTGLPLVVQAPWPKDLTVAVKYLRKYAPV